MGDTDILKLLEGGQTVQISPEGYSMYPMLVPGRDAVVLEALENTTIRRGDVLLFRDTLGRLVVHRVYKVTDESVFFIGDNQTEEEGPVPYHQIYGKMTTFLRKGRQISTGNFFYQCYWRLWLLLRPLRTLRSKLFFSHNNPS